MVFFNVVSYNDALFVLVVLLKDFVILSKCVFVFKISCGLRLVEMSES